MYLLLGGWRPFFAMLYDNADSADNKEPFLLLVLLHHRCVNTGRLDCENGHCHHYYNNRHRCLLGYAAPFGPYWLVVCRSLSHSSIIAASSVVGQTR